MAIFERLAKDFEGGTRKLCELVEKEDTAMRERDFPGNWPSPATEKTYRTHGVVWRSERPRGDEHPAALLAPHDRMYLRDLKRFLYAHGRENRWYSPSDHRLARPGRADHQEVVPAGNCNLDRRAQTLLPLHVCEVVAMPFISRDE